MSALAEESQSAVKNLRARILDLMQDWALLDQANQRSLAVLFVHQYLDLEHSHWAKRNCLCPPRSSLTLLLADFQPERLLSPKSAPRGRFRSRYRVGSREHCAKLMPRKNSGARGEAYSPLDVECGQAFDGALRLL